MPRQSPPLLDQCRYVARLLRRPVWDALLILSFGIPASAQTYQAWPEISTFVKLNERMRFYFFATTVKENRETTEGEFGPNFDIYFKPLEKAVNWFPRIHPRIDFFLSGPDTVHPSVPR